MKLPVVIKPSPLVLIRRIIGVEIVVSLILFFISFIANYEEIYESTPLGSAIRYDIFLVVATSVIQLIITLLIFFWWNNEEYRIKEKEIIRKRGMFFDKQNSVLLKKISEVEFKRNPLEFLLGYGTIVLHLSPLEKPMYIRSVDNAEVYANVIKDAVDDALAYHSNGLENGKASALDLILEGEHARLEMKQTFRWDGKRKITSKELEKAVMKTVAAFLNTDGGQLLIGVADNGNIFGLEDDFKSLTRKNHDGFENAFNQSFKNMLGAEFRQYVGVRFESIEDKDVCIVDVEQSPKPVFLDAGNGEEQFFIRTGNTTSALKMSEVNSYIATKWNNK
jgi:membrane protein YdbS with pleckstrin-like domain